MNILKMHLKYLDNANTTNNLMAKNNLKIWSIISYNYVCNRFSKYYIKYLNNTILLSNSTKLISKLVILLRNMYRTKPKGSIIENKNITVKADQTPKTNLNSKFMASVLQNSWTRSKEDVSLAREPFINKINKEIIQKDNGQINHKRRNIINKFKQKALETAYKSINKQRISENKKKYKYGLLL